MSEMQWLPLAEYAVVKGISVSTIRRKIKANKIEYRMEGGKYFIHNDLSPSAKKQSAVKPKVKPSKSTNVFTNISDDQIVSNIERDLIEEVNTRFKPLISDNTETKEVSKEVSLPIPPRPIMSDIGTKNNDEIILKNTSTLMKKTENDQTSMQNELRWKALEARVAGLAKQVEYLSEKNSELNMLVKIFEEKLNATL